MIHSRYTLSILITGIFLGLIGILSAQNVSGRYNSIDGLETRISEVEVELSHLAEFTIRGGVGAVGYRSLTPSNSVNPKEWVQIDLLTSAMVDRIVLVPCLWRSPNGQFTADSFPLEFKIIGGSTNDTEGVLLAERNNDLTPYLPRTAPLTIDIPPTRLSWVRIEAERLSPRIWDHNLCLQLAEVLVFEKHRNVALKAQVTASSSEEYTYSARHKNYLVDGFTPYIMNAATGQQSLAFVTGDSTELPATPTISVDLGQSHMITQINLHSTEVSDSVPQTEPNDFGIPRKLQIHAANRLDFSDGQLIAAYEMNSIYDAGPIIMLPIAPTTYRYLRLLVNEPYRHGFAENIYSRIGFAEIEVISDGRNIAQGITADPNFKVDNPARFNDALTDGYNYYGDILPVRDWLEQLSRRHDLENELPQLRTEVKHRYTLQQKNFQRLLWFSAILLLGTVILILIQRMIRQRVVFRTREQIAADLHDELGASLHALSLLSEITENATDKPEKLKNLLQRIRAITQRTVQAARHCTNLLESKELYEDVGEHIRRTSKRMLADLEHEIQIEGAEHLRQLSSRKRIDLCLFHKECLANIIRHSGATTAQTTLIATPKHVSLEIYDNGHGIPDEHLPKSIKRRSQLLGAHIELTSNSDDGTRIALTYRYKHFYLFSLASS
jgi:signal transduction histidine kinase